MADFFQIIFERLVIIVTAITVAISSPFNSSNSVGNQPSPSPHQEAQAVSPTPSISEIPKHKEVKREAQTTSPSNLSQKNNPTTTDDRKKELQNELQKINQIKQQSTESQPTLTPAPAATTTSDYSDYNFSYTYANEYPQPAWRKILRFSPTSRDLRLTRAIFSISNDDAEKYDSITDHSSNPPRLWFCKQQECQSYLLERRDKNSFLYSGSRFSGIPIAQGYIYIAIPIPSFAEGWITNISLPMSEWEIWDNTTTKLVKTQ